jgi:hypothetical protein
LHYWKYTRKTRSSGEGLTFWPILQGYFWWSFLEFRLAREQTHMQEEAGMLEKLKKSKLA